MIIEILKEIKDIPNEFQLLPYGRIDIEGEPPAYVDEESIASVIANFARRGNDMVIDYEHQTLKDVQAPAAGWIKRLVDKGREGIWAVVEWTERAKEYLKNREYRYFSPVFWVAKEGRRVVRIENVALTNLPKINQLRPIVAKLNREEARAAQERRSRKYGIGIKEGGHVTKPSEWADVPDDQWLDPVNYRYPCPDAEQTRAAASYWGMPKNRAQYTPKERSIIEERLNRFRKKFGIGEFRKEAKMIEKLRKIFGLADDAGEDKVLEAAEAVVAKNKDRVEVVACKEVLEALKLKEDADKEKVIASISALQAPATAAQELSQEVARLKSEIAIIKQDDLVQLALKEGKTSPEELDKWGRDLALKSPELFKLIVLSRPAGSVVPVQGLKPAKDKKDELDEVQMSINKMLGIDEETWKKYGPQAEA